MLVGAERIAPLARHGAAGAEVAVVEGVMGLFDGRIADGAGSTAQVANLLGAPVVLVVDCRGQSRSLAALLHGFRSFDAGDDQRVRLAGVVLNRVGSARHEEVLRAAADEAGLPVLGALPRLDALAVPSRHLGLVTAAEHGDGGGRGGGRDGRAGGRARGPRRGSRAGRTASARPGVEPGRCGRGALWLCTRRAWWASCAPRTFRTAVAVFGGPAFTFGYAEHVELLAAAGASVVTVDPLRDEALPPGTAALVLPGGFPEEHVAALAANTPLREAVRALAVSGAPVHAECGGLLFLCESLDGAPMCGVLPATAAMGGRLTLGYRDAVAVTTSPLFPAGARVAGHEFHHSTVTPRAGADPAWGWRGGQPEGFVAGGLHASYLHTHPAAHPGAIARFVAAAAGRPADLPAHAGG